MIRGVHLLSATLSGAIAAAAFVLSFTALTDLARMSGAIASPAAPLLAVIVDLFLVQGTVGLLHAAQAGDGRARRYWWLMLGIFAGLSTVGNGYHALVTARAGELPELVSAAIAVVAPLALVASTHGLVMHLWGARISHDERSERHEELDTQSIGSLDQERDTRPISGELTATLQLAADPREHALLLVAEGATHGEAARAVGVDRSTVSRWAAAKRSVGLAS